MKEHYREILFLLILIIIGRPSFCQEPEKFANYLNPQEYTIAGITVSGVMFLDPNALIGISGLHIGQRADIPGEQITAAVKKLWDQGLFSDVSIVITKTEGENIWLDIHLQERPRLSSVRFDGIKKSEIDDITEKINLPNGSQLTDHLLNMARKAIVDHYTEKGYLNAAVNFIKKDDPDQPNNIILTIEVDKGEKIKIGEIEFTGNDFFSDKRLRKVMKNTKQKDLNIFKGSKLIDKKFDEDRESLVKFYNKNGFRDFRIVTDSVLPYTETKLKLKINVYEGSQYYLRNVDWVGNSIYSKEQLSSVFNVPKGEVYDQAHIEDRLVVDEDAVNSLYLDYGYLFSRVTPVEKNIDGDSIDIEVRIFEGEPANISNVIVTGNTRTNEHVARRELYTLPGDLFSKEKIIRSVRQLGVLGHFDAEKIVPQPISDQVNGTVDILYPLEERANDQFEVSGGWGANMLVGTVGVRFNNFSMKNFFDWKQWRPYPSGDGQSLSLRVQSNGRIYQSYNFSFVEPWLGGKKPNSLSISYYRSLMTNGQKRKSDTRQSMIIDGASIGFGKRLTWPDDYFSVYYELGYQRYDLNNYQQYQFLFENGVSNMLSLTGKITRFSAGPNSIFPRSGSTVSLSVQATPPYSLFNTKNYAGLPDYQKYKWIEFYKIVFKADYYFPLTNDSKLILNAKAAFGYLGHYDDGIGPSPFENFYVGGGGMTGYSFYGREIVAMRGYTDGSLTPNDPYTTNRQVPSGNVYSKITFELRYPISLNPQATIYGLAFLETGKSWYSLSEYNPFKMNRSAGIGLRANLPMFGLLGIDWGYGFDEVPYNADASGGHFNFVIGQQF
jgi:outer membrane protein insertion porin family